jgi:hypothetical protein
VSRRLRAALATLVVGAAAYVGLFLLLTAHDRKENAEALRQQGDALLDAREPGELPPGGDAPRVRAWKRAESLWKDRQDYERREKKTRYLAMGLFGALAAQVVITGAVLLRSRGSAPGPASGPPRARGPGS